MAHPRARGLLHAWIFNEGPGGVPRCAVTGLAATVSNNGGTVTWTNSQVGPSQVFAASGTGLTPPIITLAAPKAALVSKAATLILIMRIAVQPPVTDGDNRTGLVTFDVSPGGTTHYPYSDGVVYDAILHSSRPGVANSGFDKTQWHNLAHVSEPGTNGWRVLQNGVRILQDTGDATLSLTTTPVLGQTNTTYRLDGGVAACFLFNRALSDAEVALFNPKASPYAMFVSPRTRVWPIASAGGGAAVAPPETSLSLTGAVPTVGVSVTLSPTPATLGLTGSTPVVQTPRAVAPVEGTLALTAATPTVGTSQIVAPVGSALAFTGSTPTVGPSITLAPTAGSLTLTAGTPVVGTSVQVVPISGALTLAPSTPVIGTSTIVAPVAASFVLTGSTPTVGPSITLSFTAGVLTLTGGTPSVGVGSTVAPVGAVLTLTAATPTVGTSITLAPAQTTLTVTGAAATVGTSVLLTPVTGSLVLTVSTPTVVASDAKIVAPTVGSLTFTLSTPTIVVGSSVDVAPATGTLVLTGALANVAVSGQSLAPTSPVQVEAVAASSADIRLVYRPGMRWPPLSLVDLPTLERELELRRSDNHT